MADSPLLPTEPALGDYDYQDPDAERQKAAAASLREQRLRNVEAALLSTTDGREWLFGILAGLHVFEPRMAMSASEYENGFWAGEREGGLRLQRRLAKSDPEKFGLMYRENDRE